MAELPDNVSLQWIGRQIMAMRDDMAVHSAILRRIENNQERDRAEWRALFDLLRHLRERLENMELK